MTTQHISFESLRNLTTRSSGLLSAEVEAQRARFGPNDILAVAENPWFLLARNTLKDPMLWLLAAIGFVMLAIGEKRDGVALLLAMFPLCVMDAFLHWRTQRSTSILTRHLRSRVTVMRDGESIEIDTVDLVPGDLVNLRANDVLPADGIFQDVEALQIDESALTGESIPITKQRTTLNPFLLAESGDVAVTSTALGFAGTRALSGSGQLRVLATGMHTEYGEIVRSVSQIPTQRTPLQTSIAHLVQGLVLAALALCILLALVRVVQGHGWLDALLSATTLAVAAIPEEFPVVFTLFLGVGVFRLAQKQVLVRRSVSVENIGRITQICTDKTGTITEGRLSLTHLETTSGLDDAAVLTAAGAASTSDTDPMDLAIKSACKDRQILPPHPLRVFSFTEDRKKETAVAASPMGIMHAYTKGAPETIVASSTLDPRGQAHWMARVSHWAKGGHKVIAIAQKDISNSRMEDEPQADMVFVGILAFEDPVRPEVPAAIRYCQANNIRVLMITGDHPDTAAAIARDAGFIGELPRVVSAEADPQQFDPDSLTRSPDFLKAVDVVARCTPIQKLHIVQALQASGELVAVTGDGVNDVPALKAADIGIAMGQRGSRSAKEVSSIILTNDNFATIVDAVREGRQLFNNIRQSFRYLLYIHVPLVLTAALIPAMGYPLLFLPIHIVWLEMIIHPSALLAFQNRAHGSLDNQAPSATLLERREFGKIALAGAAATAAIGVTFVLALQEPMLLDVARSKAMLATVIWSAGLVVRLTKLRTLAAATISGATIVSLLACLNTHRLAEALHLAPLGVSDWMMTLGVISLCLLLIPASSSGPMHRPSPSN